MNLSELRLYYYPANNPGIVETYPVSVGRDGFATPVGITRTTVKVKDPARAPPASMRREAAARGEPAPAIVPPGPDNPLGRHAILLAMPSYLIHGTNRPDGVGMRASRGCIRMYPEDIESLYERLPSGTQVNLMDAPFKAGWGLTARCSCSRTHSWRRTSKAQSPARGHGAFERPGGRPGGYRRSPDPACHRRA